MSNETAPIVLIGTRKDKISKPSDHQRISTILYENFASSLAWANVIENENAVGANGRASLFFYPVDNVEGRSDPTVVACMKDIEKVIDESDYVHKEQPLVYLQALDKMFLLKKAFLSFDEAAGVAIKCGVPLAGVTHMLKLFHEMGMLMFHDEPELRNVVILDPISYFVSPVTLIICKHVPTDSDPTHHLLDVHKMCRKKKHAQWQKMTNYGVVDTDLLRLLLNEHADNVNQLVRLMTKFGLLVRLQSSDSNESASDMLDSDEYLVPALLPVNVSKDFLWSDQSFSTCYLVFTTSTDFANFTTISGNDLRLYGFLPKGLFERLLGKAVTWVKSVYYNCPELTYACNLLFRLNTQVLIIV